MTEFTKEKWNAAFETLKKEDCALLDRLLNNAASCSDGTEAMKYSQAALNFTQSIQNKYSFLLPGRPKGFYDEDKQPG